MEYVGEQPPAPDYHADLHCVEPSCPIVYGCWAVASQPATDGNSVGELEADSKGPHKRVYGRHARVKHERSEKGTIEVMDGLFDIQKELVSNVSYQRMLVYFCVSESLQRDQPWSSYPMGVLQYPPLSEE